LDDRVALAAPLQRVRVQVAGLVQGVGFRPYVYRLAVAHGLNGFVRNGPAGVEIEVEGDGVAAFLARLRGEAPAAARIDHVATQPIEPGGGAGFIIADSLDGMAAATAIGPDLAPCAACLDELFDPANRRYRHPLISCSHCGPRFTISAGVPYDRARTSLADFPLCQACAGEYTDPADRRFHAEPIGCFDCGPQLSQPVETIVAALQAGQIVALKGPGGYQLVCDARSERAVARLRQRKQRDAKPFAIMVAGVASARSLALVSDAEALLLQQPSRPIVLLDAPGHGLAPALAPGLATLGVMLPATPLHALLFHEAAGRPSGTAWMEQPQPLVLVMTSANLSGDPIIHDDAAAQAGLAGIADLIVSHNRAILARCDDSVARVIDGAPRLIRRSRGFTPVPIALSDDGPCVVALGGYLKASVCVTRGREAFLSQHVGDLDTVATRAFQAEALAHLLDILQVEPEAIAVDLHPDLMAADLAHQFGRPVIPVQHHHAHIASVCAEQRLDGPMIGLALDGYGYGSDGAAWGGELLHAKGDVFTRLGGLAPLALPGGDRAARAPWRMAASVLHALGRDDAIASRFSDEPAAAGVAALLASGRAAVTSSAGRLFDAAAALLGLCTHNRFEGEAAMRLEAAAAGRVCVDPEGYCLSDGHVSLLPLLARLAGGGVVPAEGAALFHGTLAAGLAALAAHAAQQKCSKIVVLSGGCCANRLLVEALAADLRGRGLTVHLSAQAPAGDGGLALGQAWVARRHLAS
jgi:hydrogenase maturation protein HypF